MRVYGTGTWDQYATRGCGNSSVRIQRRYVLSLVWELVGDTSTNVIVEWRSLGRGQGRIAGSVDGNRGAQVGGRGGLPHTKRA
eukprot:gene9917-biopygen395